MYEDFLLKNESDSKLIFELINENTISTLISDPKHKSGCSHDGRLVKRQSDIISCVIMSNYLSISLLT